MSAHGIDADITDMMDALKEKLTPDERKTLDRVFPHMQHFKPDEPPQNVILYAAISAMVDTHYGGLEVINPELVQKKGYEVLAVPLSKRIEDMSKINVEEGQKPPSMYFRSRWS